MKTSKMIKALRVGLPLGTRMFVISRPCLKTRILCGGFCETDMMFWLHVMSFFVPEPPPPTPPAAAASSSSSSTTNLGSWQVSFLPVGIGHGRQSPNLVGIPGFDQPLSCNKNCRPCRFLGAKQGVFWWDSLHFWSFSLEWFMGFFHTISWILGWGGKGGSCFMVFSSWCLNGKFFSWRVASLVLRQHQDSWGNWQSHLFVFNQRNFTLVTSCASPYLRSLSMNHKNIYDFPTKISQGLESRPWG